MHYICSFKGSQTTFIKPESSFDIQSNPLSTQFCTLEYDNVPLIYNPILYLRSFVHWNIIMYVVPAFFIDDSTHLL